MKRLLLICIMTILIVSLDLGHCEDKAKYEALTNVDFHLYTTPEGKKIAKVPKGSKINIVEWSDEWCLAEYEGKTGYIKTAWIYALLSLNPYTSPLPDNPCTVSGYIVLHQETQINVGEYNETIAAADTIVCAQSRNNDFYEMPVWRTIQQLPTAEASYYAFGAWNTAEPGAIIGGYTTYYSDSLGKKYPTEREHNIQLGCARINGFILNSGESFSFNALCGPYRKKNGYLLAPNVSRDGVGYGGGICQVSTTLYNALLTLPLQIDTWHIHRYSGVAYVPQFYDAAVGSYSDLVFTNTLPYSIRIDAYAENGIVNVFITRVE